MEHLQENLPLHAQEQRVIYNICENSAIKSDLLLLTKRDQWLAQLPPEISKETIVKLRTNPGTDSDLFF